MFRLRVCQKGHILTSDTAKTDRAADYCVKCGSPIISECSECKKALQSPHIISSIKDFQHCMHCGKPHPWHNQGNQ